MEIDHHAGKCLLNLRKVCLPRQADDIYLDRQVTSLGKARCPDYGRPPSPRWIQ